MGNFNKIRLFLLHNWDPIGVSGDIYAENEYDNYVPRICDILGKGGGSSEIFNELWRIETQYMELEGDQTHTQKCANAIVDLVLKN